MGYWIYEVPGGFGMMIIVPAESHLLQVLNALESWRWNNDFKIQQILYRKRTGVPRTGTVQENVQFSIVFGKMNFYSDDLSTLQNGRDWIWVVKKLSPVSSKVAYVAGAGSDILKVHLLSGQCICHMKRQRIGIDSIGWPGSNNFHAEDFRQPQDFSSRRGCAEVLLLPRYYQAAG